MPGVARKVTIFILLVLMVVLAIIAFVIWNNARNAGTRIVAIDGASCPAGTASQCQANNAGNTGYLCNCIQVSGSYRWDCSTKDNNRCPLPGAATCQAGQVQSGQCGTSSCDGDERPVQTCGADGKFGAIECKADATCVGNSSSTSTSTSSATSSAASSSISSSSSSTTTSTISTTTSSSSAATTVGTFACGSVCETTGDCAAGLTCHSGKCASEACLDGEIACGTNYCPTSELPDTGIFDTESRPLLIGIMLVLGGLLFNRFLNFSNLGGRSYEEKVARSVER